ncbi:hypothetical protein GCM10023350_31520 [Nocardioides endophyticus]|uniref:Secreted protein n=1 Tax=Nocardioides endophyticus TaxID=1353775 RepID=A0ABP8Z2A8_9ACTN
MWPQAATSTGKAGPSLLSAALTAAGSDSGASAQPASTSAAVMATTDAAAMDIVVGRGRLRTVLLQTLVEYDASWPVSWLPSQRSMADLPGLAPSGPQQPELLRKGRLTQRLQWRGPRRHQTDFPYTTTAAT